MALMLGQFHPPHSILNNMSDNMFSDFEFDDSLLPQNWDANLADLSEILGLNMEVPSDSAMTRSEDLETPPPLYIDEGPGGPFLDSESKPGPSSDPTFDVPVHEQGSSSSSASTSTSQPAGYYLPKECVPAIVDGNIHLDGDVLVVTSKQRPGAPMIKLSVGQVKPYKVAW